MGIAYFDESREELEADLKTLESVDCGDCTKEKAFKEFMDKMCAAEKSVECNGYYSEEELEEELAKI